MRTRLIGDHVDRGGAAHQLRQDIGRIRDEADGPRGPFAAVPFNLGESVVERWRDLVEESLTPFIVTAIGWAPPMPPSPAETTSRPASVPPKCFAATAANVSYVP